MTNTDIFFTILGLFAISSAFLLVYLVNEWEFIRFRYYAKRARWTKKSIKKEGFIGTNSIIYTGEYKRKRLLMKHDLIFLDYEFTLNGNLIPHISSSEKKTAKIIKKSFKKKNKQMPRIYKYIYLTIGAIILWRSTELIFRIIEKYFNL